jgi:RNA polymerase sigma factor (sigma-70 family)
MAQARLTTVLRHIRTAVGARELRDQADEALLRRFVAGRDEAAFRALVDRHGRLVMGVCRQVLRQRQDAEDAFQATFLVLARRAASIRTGAALPGWLYRVAHRTANELRRATERRRWHERRAQTVARPEPDLGVAWQELQAVLAEEVSRLPDKFRAPFVLCCLEGRGKEEAATQLGWKVGTVSWRLAEARRRLQGRLTRRGLMLEAALCAGAVMAGEATAAAPALVRVTVQAAAAVAAGEAAGVSARVADLAEGVTKALFLSKAKVATAVLLALGLSAAGVGVRLHGGSAVPDAGVAAATRPADEQARPAAADTITIAGRVLGPDGQPVAGAELVLVPFGGSAEKPERRVRARSGADGRFRFTATPADLPEHTVLMAAARGYGPAWTDDAAALGKDEVTLRLVNDVPVTGRVLDLEGRPVPGARVWPQRLQATPGEDLTAALKDWNPYGDRPSALLSRQLYLPDWAGDAGVVTTDAAGRFRMTGLGRERLAFVRVEGPTIEHKVLFVVTRPGVDVKALTARDPDTIMPGMAARAPRPLVGPTFDHAFRPTKPIVGTVRDRATGQPLAKAYVGGHGPGAWSHDDVTTRTDEQGRYRLVGVPKGPGYTVGVYGVVGRDDYLPAEHTVGDSDGLVPLTADVEVVHGVRVRGRVTDKATGQPVRAALWYFPLADNKQFGGLPGTDFFKHVSMGYRTDADGRFSVLALPGSGVLKFRANVDDESNPYAQVAIAPAHRARAYSTDPKDGLSPSFLSAGGAIETLRYHNAYALIEPEPGAGPVTCDVQFDRGKTLSGRVVDPDGRPLAGAQVCGRTALGGTETLEGDAVTALALDPDQPRVVAFIHRERRLAGHVTLRGDEAGPVTIRLQSWGVLTGRLLDEDGKPVVGATVSLSCAGDTVRWLTEAGLGGSRSGVRTDADGRFRIEGVFPEVDYRLGFQKDRFFRDVDAKYRQLTLRPAETRDLGEIPSRRRPD